MTLDNQSKMQNAFKAAMLKLSLLGNDKSKMVDCSEVIPTPASFNKAATFPAGLSINDVEQAVCAIVNFMALLMLTYE